MQGESGFRVSVGWFEFWVSNNRSTTNSTTFDVGITVTVVLPVEIILYYYAKWSNNTNTTGNHRMSIIIIPNITIPKDITFLTLMNF